MGTLLIKNGYIVNPGSDFEGKADLFIRNGIIEKTGTGISAEADRTIDAKGLTILPGLVDLHVHLRDPGQEYKEGIGSGSDAAAHGGVTSLLAMGNTRPVMDSINRAAYVINKARDETAVHIYQAGTITKGMQGEELVNMEEMVRGGIRAFSEDGKSVMNAELLRKAMNEALRLGVPLAEHCEDITMVRGGVMNEDANAKRLGLPGISNAVEDVIVARDCVLAAETGCALHLCHCSTKGSAELIRFAKKLGANVTAEVCPHHFTLTSDDIPGDDANYKMNPPLRTKEDVEALKEALADGTIGVISTDHAPHAPEEKRRGFMEAPFGITGLETSAALTYTELVKPGILTLMQMAEKMSLNPAKVLGIDAGTLDEGRSADIAVFDFTHKYRIDPARFLSKGKNTPFAGRTVYGRTVLTVSGGKIVWEDLR